jgi:hypothetical protein
MMFFGHVMCPTWKCSDRGVLSAPVDTSIKVGKGSGWYRCDLVSTKHESERRRKTSIVDDDITGVVVFETLGSQQPFFPPFSIDKTTRYR